MHGTAAHSPTQRASHPAIHHRVAPGASRSGSTLSRAPLPRGQATTAERGRAAAFVGQTLGSLVLRAAMAAEVKSVRMFLVGKGLACA